jgi:hypothetical protein
MSFARRASSVLTVDVCVPVLAADFAVDVAYAAFLVHAHGDGFLVVAEEALEYGGEGFFLCESATWLAARLFDPGPGWQEG